MNLNVLDAQLKPSKGGKPPAIQMREIILDGHVIINYDVARNQYIVEDSLKRWKPFTMDYQTGKRMIEELEATHLVHYQPLQQLQGEFPTPEKTQYQVNYKLISDIDPELRDDGTKNPFLRIFQSDLSDELWAAYCSALGVTEDPKSVKSLRVYFTGAKPDRYNDNGEIENL